MKSIVSGFDSAIADLQEKLEVARESLDGNTDGAESAALRFQIELLEDQIKKLRASQAGFANETAASEAALDNFHKWRAALKACYDQRDHCNQLHLEAKRLRSECDAQQERVRRTHDALQSFTGDVPIGRLDLRSDSEIRADARRGKSLREAYERELKKRQEIGVNAASTFTEWVAAKSEFERLCFDESRLRPAEKKPLSGDLSQVMPIGGY